MNYITEGELEMNKRQEDNLRALIILQSIDFAIYIFRLLYINKCYIFSIILVKLTIKLIFIKQKSINMFV